MSHECGIIILKYILTNMGKWDKKINKFENKNKLTILT